MCVRACVRVCVRACVRVRVCVLFVHLPFFGVLIKAQKRHPADAGYSPNVANENVHAILETAL